jgi:hypothetical protein
MLFDEILGFYHILEEDMILGHKYILQSAAEKNISGDAVYFAFQLANIYEDKGKDKLYKRINQYLKEKGMESFSDSLKEENDQRTIEDFLMSKKDRKKLENIYESARFSKYLTDNDFQSYKTLIKVYTTVAPDFSLFKYTLYDYFKTKEAAKQEPADLMDLMLWQVDYLADMISTAENNIIERNLDLFEQINRYLEQLPENETLIRYGLNLTQKKAYDDILSASNGGITGNIELIRRIDAASPITNWSAEHDKQLLLDNFLGQKSSD